MNKTKIIFWGTGNFAVLILKALIRSPFPPHVIVTQPDKPQKRSIAPLPSPVKAFALKQKLKVAQPESLKQPDFIKEINYRKPDLCIIADYGKILPKSILEIPPLGFLNIHPSLLPKYRGPSPIASAILNNEKITGVSLMLLDEHMDSGPILAQKTFPIKNTDTKKSLETALAKFAANMLLDILPLFLEQKIKPKEQNHQEATFSKLLSKQDGKIDWSNSAEKISRQIRAFYPWPGSWTIWQEKNQQIIILQASFLNTIKSANLKNGTIQTLPQKKIGIVTGKGYLILEKLQLAGRKVLNADEFIRGQPSFSGGHLI